MGNDLFIVSFFPTKAMDLLEYGICSMQGLPWPERTAPASAKDLPKLQGKSHALPQLYGMFCLCEEYQLYLQASYQDMLDSGWPQDEPPSIQSLVTFLDFCELPPGGRARLLLKRSHASTVVEDIHRWLQISVPTCEGLQGIAVQGDSLDSLARLGRACLLPKTEETLANVLLGRLGSKGWDPEEFKLLAQVVQASSPALPRAERIIKDHTVLMEFIFNSVYSEDQRCHAADIFDSVDSMYGCIPKPDSDATGDAESWAKYQKQADELEKHLTCVELLLKHKIKLSLSFADLRSGCSNENMAIHSMWNLFRVLGTRYRPALFWRGFQQELFYLHTHAFAAVSMNSVYEMYVRCLAEQDHVEVMNSVVESWTLCCGDNALTSLVALAQELVNGSPALRHADLEKATRLLKCAQSSEAAAELDFIKSCELLHDLLWRKPKRTLRWVQSAVHDITSGQALAHFSEMGSNLSKDITSGQAFAHFSEMRSNLSKFGQNVFEHRDPSDGNLPAASAASIEGFHIETPVQLRLRISKPLRIVTDLLEFNPPILLESEDLQRFCSLIGLPPSSSTWAEVMALCGAAHLLCGDRAEALSITEKLLVNKHPGAWKLAVALATDDGVDQASAAGLLADAARVCSEEDLPIFLSYLDEAPDCRLQDPEAALLPMDLDDLGETGALPIHERQPQKLEAAWQTDDVDAAAAALLQMEPSETGKVAMQVKNFLTSHNMEDSDAWDKCADLLDSGECPEIEPDRVSASSALQALCESFPDLDSALGMEELVERLLNRASSQPSESLGLARAVAGVPELLQMGVTSSTIALNAAKALIPTDSDLGPLVFWLEPKDALQLLDSALDDECPRTRTLEVIALLRCNSEATQLSAVLRQAEALTLLRSTGKLERQDVNLRLHPELSMEEAKRRWLQELAHLDSFLPLAETLLETGFTWAVKCCGRSWQRQNLRKGTLHGLLECERSFFLNLQSHA